MANSITNKRKILFFIPFGITSIILCYSWISFIASGVTPFVQHYLGLLLFLPVLYFLLADKTFKKPVILMAIYLLLATITIVSFFTSVSTSSFGVNIGTAKIMTPGVNGSSFLILLLYGVLNFDTLVDIYYDYKESKGTL